MLDNGISNLQKAKQLIKDGELENARALLEGLLLDEEVGHKTYQTLLNVCAFTGDIEGFLKFYTDAIKLGLSKKIHLHQFYHNILYKIKHDRDINKLIDFFQTLVDSGQDLDKFAYLSLSLLFAKAGKIKNSIDINQKCLRKFVLSHNKLDLVREVVTDKIKLRNPDFIIIGTLKSGTTSLYDYLMQHPKFLPALIKEIKFFSSYFTNGSEWYFSHFPGNFESGFLTGEASPGYFSSALAPERIYQTIPEVKLILCLRNPVDRTLSHYFMKVREGSEPQNIENLLQEIEQDANLVDNTKLDFWRGLNPCFSNSLYYLHLRRWLYFFPLKQIKIVDSDELFKSPQKVLDSVFDFLEIEQFEPKDIRVKNEGDYSQISDDIRTRISSFFKPHNHILESILSRKFNWF